MDPSSADTVYVVAQGRLFKTTQGGLHWFPRPPVTGTDNDTVNAVVVEPGGHHDLYAGWGFGIARSSDGGETWSLLVSFEPTHSSGSVDGLAPVTSRPGTVYFHTYNALYVTRDAAATANRVQGPWVPDGVITSLATDPGLSGGIWVGTSQGVYRSYDEGVHWQFAGRGLPNHITQIVVDPASSSTVYAVSSAEPGVYKTEDSGNFWFRLDLDFAYSVAVTSIVPSRLVVGANGEIFVSEDDGRKWEEHEVGTSADSRWVVPVAIAPSDPEVLVVGVSNSGLFRSDDGGRTWHERDDGLPGSGVYDVTSGTDRVYAASSGNLFRRHAVGWENLGLPRPDQVTLEIDPSNGTTLLTGLASCDRLMGCGGELRRSEDGGDSWVTLLHGAVFDVVVDPIDPDRIFVSLAEQAPSQFPGELDLAGAILRSLDRGESWERMEFPQANPPRLTFDPSRPGTLYAAAGLFGVFRSTDYGAAWTELSEGFSGAIVQHVAVDDSTGRLYAGAIEGIYLSTDGGAHWSRVLDFVRTNTILVDPAVPGSAWAATDEGVLRTVDGGVTWSRDGDRRRAYGLSFDPAGTRLYAATDEGVYERQVRRLPRATSER